MQKAVRNYWACLDKSGKEAAACFHPDGGYFLAASKHKMTGQGLVNALQIAANKGGNLASI